MKQRGLSRPPFIVPFKPVLRKAKEDLTRKHEAENNWESYP